MLTFLFLLLLCRIAELDWRSKMFDFAFLSPIMLLILLYHPNKLPIFCTYIVILLANHLTHEHYIGNGDIDILWIGYCLQPFQTWAEWLLLACISQYFLQMLTYNTTKPTPFAPSLALSFGMIYGFYA